MIVLDRTRLIGRLPLLLSGARDRVPQSRIRALRARILQSAQPS